MAMRGAQFPGISLNFWEDSFSNPDFVDHVIRNQSKFPCPLSVELIHLTVNPSQTVLWALDQLRDVGVRIDLDDFGADAGSITGLIELRPTSIKIDPKLVVHTDHDERRPKLLASIIEMAHAQGIKAGAKGIETLEQIELLRSLGCDHVQGRALNGALTREDLYTCLTGSPAEALFQFS